MTTPDRPSEASSVPEKSLEQQKAELQARLDGLSEDARDLDAKHLAALEKAIDESNSQPHLGMVAKEVDETIAKLEEKAFLKAIAESKIEETCALKCHAPDRIEIYLLSGGNQIVISKVGRSWKLGLGGDYKNLSDVLDDARNINFALFQSERLEPEVGREHAPFYKNPATRELQFRTKDKIIDRTFTDPKKGSLIKFVDSEHAISVLNKHYAELYDKSQVAKQKNREMVAERANLVKAANNLRLLRQNYPASSDRFNAAYSMPDKPDAEFFTYLAANAVDVFNQLVACDPNNKRVPGGEGQYVTIMKNVWDIYAKYNDRKNREFVAALGVPVEESAPAPAPEKSRDGGGAVSEPVKRYVDGVYTPSNGDGNIGDLRKSSAKGGGVRPKAKSDVTPASAPTSAPANKPAERPKVAAAPATRNAAPAATPPAASVAPEVTGDLALYPEVKSTEEFTELMKKSLDADVSLDSGAVRPELLKIENGDDGSKIITLSPPSGRKANYDRFSRIHSIFAPKGTGVPFELTEEQKKTVYIKDDEGVEYRWGKDKTGGESMVDKNGNRYLVYSDKPFKAYGLDAQPAPAPAAALPKAAPKTKVPDAAPKTKAPEVLGTINQESTLEALHKLVDQLYEGDDRAAKVDALMRAMKTKLGDGAEIKFTSLEPFNDGKSIRFTFSVKQRDGGVSQYVKSADKKFLGGKNGALKQLIKALEGGDWGTEQKLSPVEDPLEDWDKQPDAEEPKDSPDAAPKPAAPEPTPPAEPEPDDDANNDAAADADDDDDGK